MTNSLATRQNTIIQAKKRVCVCVCVYVRARACVHARERERERSTFKRGRDVVRVIILLLESHVMRVYVFGIDRGGGG